MIDLHLHSTCSDGTCTPREVILKAKEKNLYAVALTDHDTVAGIKEARTCARANKIQFISGIEMSCEVHKREIHILGYGIDEEDETLQKTLEGLRKKRNQRNQEMIRLFEKDGISITFEELQGGNPNTVITRAHFGRVLIERGICKDKEEAFEKYVGDGCKYYIPKPYLSPADGMSIIRNAGGIAVLAHPFQYHFSNHELEMLIVDLKKQGLRGIEVYHGTHHRGQSERLKEWCKKYELLATGGSDFHGKNKPGLEVGTGYGGLKIPDLLFEHLRNC